jgi:tRNA (guanine37-N1)-methyltransferase
LAAAVLCDAVIRLLPGALGDERSSVDESFSDAVRLEAPAYTRPIDFRGMKVPEVLTSGHHGDIAAWKEAQSEQRTQENRPDLFTSALSVVKISGSERISFAESEILPE